MTREFQRKLPNRLADNARNPKLVNAAEAFLEASVSAKYSYNFSWLGRPIIQYPQDIVAMQELVWSVQPDLIIETGIAHGGALILYTSLLGLKAACGGPREAPRPGAATDNPGPKPKADERHPPFSRTPA